MDWRILTISLSQGLPWGRVEDEIVEWSGRRAWGEWRRGACSLAATRGYLWARAKQLASIARTKHRAIARMSQGNTLMIRTELQHETKHAVSLCTSHPVPQPIASSCSSLPRINSCGGHKVNPPRVLLHQPCLLPHPDTSPVC